MKYFLLDRLSLIHVDENEHRTCFSLRVPMINFPTVTAVVSGDHYLQMAGYVVNAIENTNLGYDQIFMSDIFFQLPGFFECLGSLVPEKQIRGMLDFYLSKTDNFVGQQSVLVLERLVGTMYELSSDGNPHYSIIKRSPLDLCLVIEAIVRNLKPYLTESYSDDFLLDSIFDHTNVNVINALLVKYQLYDPEQLKYLNFKFEPNPFESVFEKDLVLYVFFNAIFSALKDFLRTQQNDSELTVFSALSEYIPVKHLLAGLYEKEISPNFVTKGERIFSRIQSPTKFFLNGVPERRPITLPFSGWLLGGSNVGAFTITSELAQGAIDYRLPEFSNIPALKESMYQVGGQSLLKCLTHLKLDCYDNFCVHIEAGQNKRFYHILKPVK